MPRVKAEETRAKSITIFWAQGYNPAFFKIYEMFGELPSRICPFLHPDTNRIPL